MKQIAAIARVRGVETIYSDDKGVATLAEQIAMVVVRTWIMPLPPEESQQDLLKGLESDRPGEP